jgi:hypothetical protein
MSQDTVLASDSRKSKLSQLEGAKPMPQIRAYQKLGGIPPDPDKSFQKSAAI